jgi:hypothetical protein
MNNLKVLKKDSVFTTLRQIFYIFFKIKQFGYAFVNYLVTFISIKFFFNEKCYCWRIYS